MHNYSGTHYSFSNPRKNCNYIKILEWINENPEHTLLEVFEGLEQIITPVLYMIFIDWNF